MISFYLSIVWVIAATIVAFLPMRRQYVPGVTLLILAPVLIVWLGYDYGFWLALLGTFAFVSMFRNPLIYFYRRARGEKPGLPK